MSPDTVDKLIDLFFMTNRSLHKYLQKAEFMKTFSLPQFIAMRMIGDEGTISMKDIARHLSITPASATSLVNGLVSLGSLERIADGKDRRIVRLRITADGSRALRGAENAAKKELKKVLLQLTDRDRSTMIAVLRKLSAILSKRTSPAPRKRVVQPGERR